MDDHDKEPGTNKGLDQDVARVTLYLTPTQWQRLSKWSAPGAAAGGLDAPWLYLSHESGKRAEYNELVANTAKELAPHGIAVHNRLAQWDLVGQSDTT